MSNETAGASKFAYVTAVTTDGYLLGALALQISLKLTHTRYRLVAVVSDNVSSRTINIMKHYGIVTIRVNGIPIPESIRDFNGQVCAYSYWNNTFDKLTIFSLIQFQKLVYVDSDMLILRNIDILFEKPHMSAVCAGQSYPGNEHWRGGLNSGLMVVEPKAENREALINCVRKLATSRKETSDQDAVKLFCPHWSEANDLELDESYNVFAAYLDYYIRNRRKILKGEKIKIVHFVGAEKPWMVSVAAQIKNVLRLVKRRKIYEALVFTFYVWIIHLTRTHIWLMEILGYFPPSRRQQA